MLDKTKSLLIALKKVFFSPRQSKLSYSQFGEDCALYPIFGGRKIKKGLFYVDVGCHHPRKGSNTYFLYKRGGRGVLIDMELEKIYACKILRPKDISILAAVSDKVEEVEIYSDKKFSNLTTISNNSREGKAVVGKIRTKTLTSILDATKYRNKEIDLLSVDVEGVDLEVLKGLDFKVYNPKVVVVESLNSNIDNILNGEIHKFLSNIGYEFTNWVGVSLIYQKIK